MKQTTRPSLHESPAARIARIEAELAQLRGQIASGAKVIKVVTDDGHGDDRLRTAAFAAWFNTPEGKAFAARHGRTAANVKYAVTKNGYVGQWAYDLLAKDGVKVDFVK